MERRYSFGAVGPHNSIYIFRSRNVSGTVPADVWKSVFVTPTVQGLGLTHLFLQVDKTICLVENN